MQSRKASEWRLPTLLANVSVAASKPHIRLPPLPPGSSFAEAYDVVMLLDNREQFARDAAGAGAKRNESFQVHIEQLRGAGIDIEGRGLPVGDALWIARCKRAVPGGPEVGAMRPARTCQSTIVFCTYAC